MQIAAVRRHLAELLTVFIVTNPGYVYIQGLDSIFAVLYVQLHSTNKLELILPIAKCIYVSYVHPFVDKSNNHLNYKYASTLTSRLLAFYEPLLFRHFRRIEFQHDFYLVQWFMTLFAHILPLQEVTLMWTHLLT
jgi:TBC domain-containing protein kinase-like protein